MLRPVIREFKEFALKGSVLDMAIGMVIGTAFGKMINSLVDDLFMPPLGYLIGRIDFSNLFVNLTGERVETLEAARKAGLPTVNYGMFLNSVLDFLIMSLCMFVTIKQVNRLKKIKPAPAVPGQGAAARDESSATEPSVRRARSIPSLPIPPTAGMDMRLCPHCLSEIPRAASRCRYCTSFVQVSLQGRRERTS